jgi:hypothetical protein
MPPHKATRVLLVLPHWMRPLDSYNMSIIAVNDDGQIDKTYNETITVTFEELRIAKARRLNEPPPPQTDYEIVKIDFNVEIKNGEGHFTFNPEHFMYVNYKLDSQKLIDSISTFMVGITIY